MATTETQRLATYRVDLEAVTGGEKPITATGKPYTPTDERMMALQP